LAPSSAASAADSNVVAWPASPAEQVRAVQQLLFDLKLLRDKPDGALGPATRAAIRDYERMAGLKESGEPSKAVFESLRQMRSLMGGKP
jgi:peptidoglycan hydrolase-like protein with peptidoglycan-binding domain